MLNKQKYVIVIQDTKTGKVIINIMKRDGNVLINQERRDIYKMVGEWSEKEAKEILPELNAEEIEELNYFSHHGYERITFYFGSLAGWYAYHPIYKKLLMCNYHSLENSKSYLIKDLLEAQDAK